MSSIYRLMVFVSFVAVMVFLSYTGGWTGTVASKPPVEAPPNSSSMPPTLFGGQVGPGSVREYLVKRAVEANLSLIRYDGTSRGVLWSDVEAEQGVHDWSKLELFESQSSLLGNNEGLTLVVPVRKVPTWAQKTPPYSCGPIAEDALDDFADFMREMVTRYSAPPYNVTYWEMWNEPDVDPALIGDSHFGCWGDNSDPYYGGGYYAEMLKQVYPAIKEANPAAQVVIGGLLLNCDPTQPPEGRDCKPGKFLEGILQNGGGDYFDIVAYHAYAYAPWQPAVTEDPDLAHRYWKHRGGVVLGKAHFLREVLAQYSLNKPLLVTETSLACHPSNEHCQGKGRKNFFALQANFAFRIYTRLWANDVLGGVWFSLNPNGWRDTDLLDRNGDPKPVYETIQFMSSFLSDATYGGRLYSHSVEGYWFRNSETSTDYRIYWTNEASITESKLLPSTARMVYDKLGHATAITPTASSMIEVGFEPIIIEMEARCTERTITSTGSGNWDNPANWNPSRVPSSDDYVWIQPGHSIRAPQEVTVRALCNEGTLESQPNNQLSLLASQVVINHESGQIVGQAGSLAQGECGAAGSSVQIGPPSGDEGVQIINHGHIFGGKGGDGEQCAGDGGAVTLLGRKTENHRTGRICAGDGGNMLGTTLRQAQGTQGTGGGKGGQTIVRGNVNGQGDLTNRGLICSGNGGTSTGPEGGGEAGNLTLIAALNINLVNGTQLAGQGGESTKDGTKGQDGELWAALDVGTPLAGQGAESTKDGTKGQDSGGITVRGATISGGKVTITGEYTSTLDMSQMNGGVVSATESITLAVGTGGTIDLSGNQEKILQANQGVAIYSDNILVDGDIQDIVNASNVVTDSARLLRRLSLSAPNVTVAQPGVAIPIRVSIHNDGPQEDTVQLEINSDNNWIFDKEPDLNSVSLSGLGTQELLLNVTPPKDASYHDSDLITITITSQSEPTVREVIEIRVLVEFPIYYFPIIFKN
ncbi:MAG: hypothetical protein ACPGWR_25745 [Ardenticatenaceae bacterium]